MDAERGADGVDAKAAWIGGRIALCIVLDILSSALSRSSACCLASRLLRSCCSSVSCSATQCRRSLTFDCAACSWPCSRAARSCCSRSSAMAAGRPDATQRAQRKHKRRLAGWGVQPAGIYSFYRFIRLHLTSYKKSAGCFPSSSCSPVDEEGRLEQRCIVRSVLLAGSLCPSLPH